MKIKIICVIALCGAYCNGAIAENIACSSGTCSSGMKILGETVWCAINSYNGNDNCYPEAKSSVLYSRLCDNGAHRGVNMTGYTRCFITQCTDTTMVPSEDGQVCGCAAGKYLNGTSCTSCPTSSDGCTTTSPKGNRLITGCYIKSGCSASDSSGAYQYTANCNYTE